MNPVIKIKRLHDDVQVPVYKRPGDAGLDLFSREDWVLMPNEPHAFKVGFHIAIPEGYVGLLWDRSGLGVVHGIKVLGGVLDHTFRGEIAVGLVNTTKVPYEVKKGDRIVQLLIQPIATATVEVVDELDETVRGTNALGSSGR